MTARLPSCACTAVPKWCSKGVTSQNHVMPWLDMTHSEPSGLATGIDSQECPAGNVWQEQELSP